MNLGYPGTNSSQVRRELRRTLETLHPDVVVLMVGANDFWTLPVPIDEVRSGLRLFLDRHSRLWRLAWTVGRVVSYEVDVMGPEGLEDEPYRGEFEPGHVPGGLVAALRGLLENLSAITAEVNGLGLEFVMMTYPSRATLYAVANRAIRTAASRSGVRLVDLEKRFALLCPAEPCPELLMADGHPTEQGYRRIAEILVREIPRTFAP